MESRVSSLRLPHTILAGGRSPLGAARYIWQKLKASSTITLIEITSGAGMKMFRHGAAVTAIALLGSVLAIADAAAQAASPVGQCAFDKKDSFLYGRVTGVEGA